MSLLASLVRAYDRLPDAPPFGYSSEKIGFCVVLNPDGSVAEVIDLRGTDKKRSPRIMNVPASPKRAGSTPRPNFLWDNANYALGIGKLKDASDMRHDAFREKHIEYLRDARSVEMRALCQFLESWRVESCADFFDLSKPPTEGLVFALSESYRNGFLHETEEARKTWRNERDRWIAVPGKSTDRAICLVSGERSAIQRTHPPIKGVWGGKTEMALVSFNSEAYESYGHQQGDNAPVSEAAAFAYTTALNRFLSDKDHRLQIGDASTVFWADAEDQKVAEEADFWAGFMLGNRAQAGPDEAIAERKIEAKLVAMRDGKPLRDIAPRLAEGVRFHVLGLAPNAARLSVRFYWEGSFGVLAEHYAAYLRDIAMVPVPAQPVFSIRAAALRSAPAEVRNGVTRYDADRVSSLLSGELTRAILTGSRFPRALLGLLLLRIRSDHVLDRIRISLIKGLILRDMRLDGRLPKHPDGSDNEEYLMEADADDPNPARRLGRLFAVIEKAQRAALGDRINTTVKDKFLGAAAATPGRVFPMLVMNAENHHLKRLRNGHSDADWIKDADHARRVAAGLGRRIGDLWQSLPDGAPMEHSAEKQGLFLVGYYQERYARRASDPQDDNADPEGGNEEQDQ